MKIDEAGDKIRNADNIPSTREYMYEYFFFERGYGRKGELWEEAFARVEIRHSVEWNK